MYQRILILSASVGNGHTIAAESLKQAFETKKLSGRLKGKEELKFINPPPGFL